MKYGVYSVLAGAYRGGARTRRMVTHAVLGERYDSSPETLCGRVETDRLSDVPEPGLPTCPVCRAKVLFRALEPIRNERDRDHAQKRRVSPHPGAEKRTFARFRSEVVALLQNRGLSKSHTLALVKRWDKTVRYAWSMGKPPCWTSDHVFRYNERPDLRPR